jgi:tRNA-splicing ligase RtcB
MLAVRTNVRPEQLEGKLPALRAEIERGVPVGFSDHRMPLEGALAWMERQGKPGVASNNESKKAAHQLGSLGGGNHFIEICLDEAGAVWVMLHSGSRGIGNKTAQKHIEKARGAMRQMFVDLPDPDLAYFAQGTEAFTAYMDDLKWCQEYAFENRALMKETVLRALAHVATGDAASEIVDGDTINCHHNYVAWEKHYGENVMVTRKGAIRARVGDMGIIPGSMGTGSFIVRGLGNPESFDSAPHGAGRKMSRTRARKTFTNADLIEQTAGVECRKDAGVLDEIPGAYKPIGEVIENSSDLVEVVARLKQFVCVKG